MDKKASKFIEEELSDLEYRETPQGGVALPPDSFDKNSQVVEMCYRTHTTTINPIIDWNDSEVWEFLKEYEIPYCCLYDEGFKRLGCIGCPMGSRQQREHEFERWPKYKHLYMLAFQKMLDNRNVKGGYRERKDIPQTADQVMAGYLTDKYKVGIPNSEDSGGGTAGRTLISDIGTADESVDDRKVQGNRTNRLYPHGQTRVRDFSEMTPEEIVEWWIN